MGPHSRVILETRPDADRWVSRCGLSAQIQGLESCEIILGHLVVGAVDWRPEHDGRVSVVGLDRADVVATARRPGNDVMSESSQNEVRENEVRETLLRLWRDVPERSRVRKSAKESERNIEARTR